ncbi:MAG: cytochrome c biogenesis protein CcsA [Saprospiraceae bacterium]|nr:cytochrome c biogenesis protein CcsA [Saprospiraceae bacterium]
MNNINYIGEHLWVGQTGHFLIILGFVSALLSAFAYYKQTNVTQPRLRQWNQIGRAGFMIHGVSVLTLIGLIFYAMYNHMYEYSYVFDHVSADLPMKYILSAFWEGQEGSFMLWMFWHIILGIILIFKAGKWEAPVLFTVAVAETILMTMILGIHINIGEESIKIGSNPTVLLRQMTDAPIFANADYLNLIKGRGLNPLLQNYWMTIHPPTLFLGFAATIVPFAYAFAGLWKNDHSGWLKPALPWSLFTAGILGTGILMGSFWAYEALSFGGYWAWDPVENASLVPWITLVAGIHTHLIAQHTGYAKKSVYFLYLISFIGILYSTFLTRSGVLGDTSAHAFTEMGLEWQLVLLVGFFLLSGLGLWIYRMKSITSPEKEEKIASREFWMFIGALVLLFSATLITASTSLPVYNKIMSYFNPSFIGRVIQDPIPHFNKYQVWIAVFVAILTSATVFLRYSGTNWENGRKKYLIRMGAYFAAAVILTGLFNMWMGLYAWQYVVLCVSGFFALAANLDYFISVMKGNLKMGASAIAHLGFGMMIIGILASGLNQKTISSNPFVFQGIFNPEDLAKYVQLIKGKPLYSKGYFITYESDSLVDRMRYYTISFKKLNDEMEVLDEIILHPNSVYSNDFSKVAAFNPDTKHYLTKDIFTCVVGLPPALQNIEEAKAIEDSLKFTTYNMLPGDTVKLANSMLVIDKVHFEPTHEEYTKHTHDAGVGVDFRLITLDGDTSFSGQTALGLDGALMYKYPEAIEDLSVRVRLDESLMQNIFTSEDDLIYKELVIMNFGSAQIDGYQLKLKGFEKDPENKNYEKEEGDIAIAADMTITSPEGKEYIATPIYIIRENMPMSIKYYIPEEGLHIRFSNIDPAKEEFSFKVAKDIRKDLTIPISVAENVPRTDYLILQATIFPGINLFWGGSILMMVGLFIGMAFRWKSRTGKTD